MVLQGRLDCREAVDSATVVAGSRDRAVGNEDDEMDTAVVHRVRLVGVEVQMMTRLVVVLRLMA